MLKKAALVMKCLIAVIIIVVIVVTVCKTGDAKISEGFDLLSRYVIHTVGPRYNVKYVTAAEGALYSSYRNVFQLVR